MEANNTIGVPSANDREEDHLCFQDSLEFDTGADPTLSVPWLDQDGVNPADGYIPPATNDPLASCLSSSWAEGNFTRSHKGALHTGESYSLNQPRSFLQKDWFPSEFPSLQDGMYDRMPSDTGSFDFASIFPRSEASLTDSADFRQSATVGLGGLAMSNDGNDAHTASFWDRTCSGWELGNKSSDLNRTEQFVGTARSTPQISLHAINVRFDERTPLNESADSFRDSSSTALARSQKKSENEVSGDIVSDQSANHACFAIPASSHIEEWPSMSPLDRWRNSPPEVEAAPLTAIINIVAQNAASKSTEGAQGLSESCPDDSERLENHSYRSPPSVAFSDPAYSGVSSSSGSSASSLNSNNSNGSFGRFYINKSSRRRRRKKAHPIRQPHSGAPRRPFQCTFCTDTFKAKYDWTRHEKTLHLSLESWVCSPFEPTFRDLSSGNAKCAFCDISSPSASHIESHRYSECVDKPAAFKTFYRKDHLHQHLRLVHGVGTSFSPPENWKSEIKNINCRCGFCGQTFVLWSERNDHIAGHFRAGALMKDWRGCRGLDPPVALAVENAMPPYLIGMQSTDPEPFSASRRNRRPTTNEKSGACTGVDESEDVEGKQTLPTPFEHLTAQLLQYVRVVQMEGTPITDEMLQKKARCIVFGDEDPWNQTAADNPEWLNFFKEGVGLGSMPFHMQPNHHGPSDSSLTSHAYNFCLPWSTDEWMPYTDDGRGHPACQSIISDFATMMPWSWQSPECLAEFQRYNCLTTPPTRPPNGK